MATLKMLIGDDGFDQGTEFDLICNLVCAIWDTSPKEMKNPIRKNLHEGTYHLEECPISGYDDMTIDTVSTVEEMIDRSNPGYDWIISDAQYHNDNDLGGLQVMEGIKNIKGPIKTIFTNTTDSQRLSIYQSALGKKLFDYLVSPVNRDEFCLKTEVLGEVMARHYLRI